MQVGNDVGEYRIVKLLGKGGMSEVYEAEHRRLGSRHAIKLFAYDKDVDGVRERFLAEGKLLARLSHPRIVRVTDEGVDGDSGRPYFVMDLVCDSEGKVRSLADFQAGEADEAQIAMWYDDMREGLAYIHGKGIVHRDLKLENVLVGPDGHVVLTDFGISKIGAAEDGGAVVDPVQTIMRLRDGKAPVMGSIGYMAPELEMGVAASPASDYYALGVIVFRLLTGTWYDAHTDVLGTLETYDPAWRQILPKLLHSNPRGRECLSWRELKEAQDERCLFDMESALEAERASARRVRLRMGIASAALLVCLVATGFAGVFLQRELSRARQELSRVPPPTFEDIVFVPPDAPEEATDSRCAREGLEGALPDAWVVLHDIFDKLRKGRITGEAAADDVSKVAKEHNMESSDDELCELLNAAAERMKERYPGK